MKVKSLSRVQLFLDPMDCSLPGSSVHGIFQARVLEWGAIISFTRSYFSSLNFSSPDIYIYIYIYSILSRMRSLGGRESIFSTPVSPVLRIGCAQTFSRHPINIC